MKRLGGMTALASALGLILSCNRVSSPDGGDTTKPDTASADPALIGSWLRLGEMAGSNLKFEHNFRFDPAGAVTVEDKDYSWNGADWIMTGKSPRKAFSKSTFRTREGLLFLQAYPIDSLPDFPFEYTYHYEIKSPDELEWSDARIFEGSGSGLAGKWTREYWSIGGGHPPVKRTQTLEFAGDGTYKNLNKDTVVSRYRDHGRFYEIYEVIPNQIPDTVKYIQFYRIKNGQLQTWSDDVSYLTREGRQLKFGTVVAPEIRDLHAGMKRIPAKGKSAIIGYDGGTEVEKPAHAVSFGYDYYMDSTEATKKQFYTLMGFRPWDKWHSDFGSGKADDFPASELNWYEAILYCNQRSKNMGLDTVYAYDSLCWGCGSNQSLRLKYLGADLRANGYRLPTNSEWEFAARGGTTTVYFWGASIDYDYADGWFELKHPVTTKRPNNFGLYGMAGGPAEWIHDCLRYYSDTPRDGSAPADCKEGEVQRGGPSHFENSFRVSFRGYHSVDYSSAGVRCALPVKD